MKRRNPVGLWPAIGLMIDQKQVAMCVTAVTAKGRRKIAHEIHECDEHTQEETVGRMLERWMSPRPASSDGSPSPWVRLGLPEARVFQAALPITPANHQHTAQNFFLEAVQATNVRAEDRIVELIKVELGGPSRWRAWRHLPATSIESSIGMISRLGARVGLIEPGPAALFRAGAYLQQSSARLEAVRSFLPGRAPCDRRPGRRHRVLSSGMRSTYPPGDEIAAILAAYSTLWMMGRHARITVPIDTVIIHGRPELALVKQADEFRQRTGTDWSAAKSPTTTCPPQHWAWRWQILWWMTRASTLRRPQTCRFHRRRFPVRRATSARRSPGRRFVVLDRGVRRGESSAQVCSWAV